MYLAKIAQRDFVFSDGTTIPKGSVIAAPALAIHSDEENYDHATSFKPWRFLAKDPDGSDGAAGSHITATSSKYLAFGHGKHAWYASRLHTIDRALINLQSWTLFCISGAEAYSRLYSPELRREARVSVMHSKPYLVRGRMHTGPVSTSPIS